jgi:hypothetical protein
MTVPSCPNHPGSTGTFDDNYQDPGYSVGASSNQAECMQRAKDYYVWCGTTTPDTAAYLVNGSVVQSTTYPATTQTTACQVTVPSCPNHPSSVGTFYDNYQDPGYGVGASSNQAECMQRAKDYYVWCGTSTPDKATYFINGAVAQTTTYP